MPAEVGGGGGDSLLASDATLLVDRSEITAEALMAPETVTPAALFT